MDSDLTLERYILPIAIGGTGVVLAWLTNVPSGLLAAVTGICILGGKRVSLLSTVVFALALAAFMIIVGWGAIVEHEAYLRLATFLAVGPGINRLIHLNQIAASSGKDEKEARLIVESMPGHGWSADANGNFVYVSPSTLNYLGQPGEELDLMEGTDGFGWLQAVHPDDYHRVVASWLHNLKTGEPYDHDGQLLAVGNEPRGTTSAFTLPIATKEGAA